MKNEACLAQDMTTGRNFMGDEQWATVIGHDTIGHPGPLTPGGHKAWSKTKMRLHNCVSGNIKKQPTTLKIT